jgi:hypothetical protein
LPVGFCRGLRVDAASQHARALNGCDPVRRSQASLHQVPLAYFMIDKIYTARRSVEMSFGHLGWRNKPIVVRMLRSTLIAIFAQPSTRPEARTIILRSNDRNRRRHSSGDL